MACISPDGTLSGPAQKVLRALVEPKALEEIAGAVEVPLYRIRSSVRELTQAGLVEETGATFVTTPAGRTKLEEAARAAEA